MSTWDKEAEKLFRKLLGRGWNESIPQWRARLGKYPERIEAVLSVTDEELEAADARAQIKKAADELENKWRAQTEQDVRERLKYVVPGWKSHVWPDEDAAAIQAKNDALAATWLPILMLELRRREAARAERDRKAQARELEEERKLKKSRGRPRT